MENMEKISFNRAVENAKILVKQGEKLHISTESFSFADDFEIPMECHTVYYPTEVPGVYRIVSKSPYFNNDIENHTTLTAVKYKEMMAEEKELVLGVEY